MKPLWRVICFTETLLILVEITSWQHLNKDIHNDIWPNMSTIYEQYLSKKILAKSRHRFSIPRYIHLLLPVALPRNFLIETVNAFIWLGNSPEIPVYQEFYVSLCCWVYRHDHIQVLIYVIWSCNTDSYVDLAFYQYITL